MTRRRLQPLALPRRVAYFTAAMKLLIAGRLYALFRNEERARCGEDARAVGCIWVEVRGARQEGRQAQCNNILPPPAVASCCLTLAPMLYAKLRCRFTPLRWYRRRAVAQGGCCSPRTAPCRHQQRCFAARAAAGCCCRQFCCCCVTRRGRDKRTASAAVTCSAAVATARMRLAGLPRYVYVLLQLLLLCCAR